jgi:hypothetical protein
VSSAVADAAAQFGKEEAASTVTRIAARIVLSIYCSHITAGYLAVDDDAQTNALRLRLYVLCSECARLIDLAEGNPPKRGIEGTDLVRHVAEEHAAWLEALDFRP